MRRRTPGRDGGRHTPGRRALVVVGDRELIDTVPG